MCVFVGLHVCVSVYVSVRARGCVCVCARKRECLFFVVCVRRCFLRFFGCFCFFVCFGVHSLVGCFAAGLLLVICSKFNFCSFVCLCFAFDFC